MIPPRSSGKTKDQDPPRPVVLLLSDNRYARHLFGIQTHPSTNLTGSLYPATPVPAHPSHLRRRHSQPEVSVDTTTHTTAGAVPPSYFLLVSLVTPNLQYRTALPWETTLHRLARLKSSITPDARFRKSQDITRPPVLPAASFFFEKASLLHTSTRGAPALRLHVLGFWGYGAGEGARGRHAVSERDDQTASPLGKPSSGRT